MSAIKRAPMTIIASVSLCVRAASRIGALVIAVLLPLTASAEPIELKLAFFTSSQSDTYRYGVKPFVDAVNAEGKGLVAIKVYPDGTLGKAVAEQPGMVLEGVADIAWIVPGQTPYQFLDNQALELPGLFRDEREGTLVYTKLIAANALRGYQDYFVIGAYTGGLQIIHSRKSLGSLAALKGQRVRVNNQMEAEAFESSRCHPHGHAGVAARRWAGAGRHRCHRHEPGRFVSVRHRALDGQPLPPRHGRRPARAGYEPQEIRQPAGSGTGAYSQIQRRTRGGGLDRGLRRHRAAFSRQSKIRCSAKGGRAVAGRPRGGAPSLSILD